MRALASLVGCALALTLTLLISLPAHARPARVRSYDSLAPIVARLRATHARVIAFGEYHQTNDGPKVPSAIARFTKQLLASFEPGASDLIVETWITKGDCGETEKQVVTQVETTTQRPEATEDEVVTLIKRAKAGGLQPHILELSCDEYRAIRSKGEPKEGPKEGIDYEKLLAVVTDHLRRGIIGALAMQAGGPPRTVLVYGGALHNDLHPRPELASYSFASAISKAVRGRYLEVDLYVPEYIASDREITAEPWYARYLAVRRQGKPTLVERGPRSFIIVFAETQPASPSSPAPASPPAPAPAAPDLGADGGRAAPGTLRRPAG